MLCRLRAEIFAIWLERTGASGDRMAEWIMDPR